MNKYFVQEEMYGELYTFNATNPEEAVRGYIADMGYEEEYGTTIKVWEAKANPKTYIIDEPTEVNLSLVKESK